VSTAVPEQFAVALGPYRVNVIDPPGEEPPDKLAVSFIVVAPTVPPALGLVARAGEAFALAPLRARLAVAEGLLLVAVSVALSVWPLEAGAYRTVTLHDVFAFSFAPLQVSPILVNADEPVRVTFSAALAAPPELASVNVWDTVWPAVKVP
jgi:hypothetical protein